jgi:hypothetical protein
LEPCIAPSTPWPDVSTTIWITIYQNRFTKLTEIFGKVNRRSGFSNSSLKVGYGNYERISRARANRTRKLFSGWPFPQKMIFAE